MYQGARNVYCRYPATKEVEMVYDLGARHLLFLDAGLVFPGKIIWSDPDGTPHPLHATADYYGTRTFRKHEVIGRPFHVPSGLAFEAQPATLGDRVDAFADLHPQIMQDGGRFRAWAGGRMRLGDQATAAQRRQSREEAAGFDLTSHTLVVRYLESDDGVDWRAPDLDVVEIGGRRTNIVFGTLQVIKQYDMETKDEENFPWTARHPGRFVGTIGMMWGVGQNMYYDDGAGAYQYGPLSLRFRVMVDFVRRAYEDGLIHPDVWSMPDEVMEGLSRQERVHFWVDNIWNGYFWGDREGKDQLEMTDHPFVAILPPMVDGQRYYASRAGNNVDTSQLWLVSAKTKYLDNILRMINWGLSEEGIYAMAMGKEDYSYVRDEQGMRIWPAPGLFTGTRAYNPETGEAKDFAAEMEIADPANFSAPEPWVILSKEFKNIWRAFRNFNNFVWPESTSVPTFYEAAPVRFADGEWLASNGAIADPAPQLTFTDEELDRRKVLETAINTLSDEMVVKFTTGQEPMSNWDAFVSQLGDLGVEELVQIYNTALGRQG